jgi:hypothetical protein
VTLKKGPLSSILLFHFTSIILEAPLVRHGCSRVPGPAESLGQSLRGSSGAALAVAEAVAVGFAVAVAVGFAAADDDAVAEPDVFSPSPHATREEDTNTAVKARHLEVADTEFVMAREAIPTHRA